MNNPTSARKLLGDISPQPQRVPARVPPRADLPTSPEAATQPPSDSDTAKVSAGPVLVSQIDAAIEPVEAAAIEPKPSTPTAQPSFDVENTEGETTAAPVYGAFFHLTESPFNLTADPRFIFQTAGIREALSNIRYGLSQSRGLTVLLGDAGTGKTTLVRAAMAELPPEKTKCILVSNPILGREEFYEFLTSAFGFTAGAAQSKARFLAELQEDLHSRAAAGGVTGLIVDEAQSLPYALLEEVRLLGNIETSNTKLLNIVLSGQPELADRLNEPSLRQLKQRVALRCSLSPLTEDEALAYISGRIRIAGGDPREIFTLEAVLAAYRASAGIPRSLNVICDNALLSGFALQVKPVTAAIVADVCRDFDFADPKVRKPSMASAPPPSHAEEKHEPRSPSKKKSTFSFFS